MSIYAVHTTNNIRSCSKAYELTGHKLCLSCISKIPPFIDVTS